MKKETKWITIPEETLHTPASGGHAEKSGESKVSNKFFWGISFIVLVVVTFALLAPTQFNELLRGSLFDAPGVESPTEGIFGEEKGGTEEVMEEEVVEEVVEEAEPVVQPEAEAVDIVIEPIVDPEEIAIEPVVEEGAEEPAEEVVEEVAEEEPDAQVELIQALSEQIEQLQKQREEDLKAMEELVSTVEEVKPAAPPSVTSTSAIGQPTALIPGFRVNPYRVAQSPEQVLQQNLTSGAQFAQAPVQSVLQTPIATSTPDTGPSEILLIAFALTFLGMLLWKFVRVFA